MSDTGTVGMEPEQPVEPCPALPVEPGDGVVTDGGDQGVAVGEPDPGPPPSGVEEEPAPEPVQEELTVGGPAPEPVGDTFCISASAPGAEDGAPGAESADGGVTSAEQLPRTGPYDRLLALTALGSGLVVVGAGATAAGGRRRTG